MTLKLMQAFDFTGYGAVHFWYWADTDSDGDLVVYVDWTDEKTIDIDAADKEEWISDGIDISGYDGAHTLKFEYTGDGRVGIDSITLSEQILLSCYGRVWVQDEQGETTPFSCYASFDELTTHTPAEITLTAYGGIHVPDAKVFLSQEITKVSFTGGSTEINIGDIVTGFTSGAKGKVIHVDLDSGSWGAGTAAGTLYIRRVW